MCNLFRACAAFAVILSLSLLPASASAVNDPQIVDHKTNKIVASHANPVDIVATNEGNLVWTNSDKETLVQCDTATLTGKLETNEGSGVNTVIEATVSTAEIRNHAATECSTEAGPVLVTPNHTSNPSPNGLPWCLRSTGTMNTHEFQIRGGGCTESERPIRIVRHVTTNFGTISCTYERSMAFVGTYKTHPTAATISISHQRMILVAGGFLCPSEWYLDQAFTLALDEGGQAGTPLSFLKGSTVNDPQVVDHKTAQVSASHASPVNIIATNEGDLVMTDAEGNVLVECETATLTGKLETNEGTGVSTKVEGTISTAEFRDHGATECTPGGGDPVLMTPNHTSNPGTGGVPWCMRSTGAMKVDEFQVRGGSCTESAGPIRFILHHTSIFGTITCTFERSEPVVGTYKTHPEAGTLQISKQRFARVAGGFLCPEEGFLDLAFTLALDQNEASGTPIGFRNQ